MPNDSFKTEGFEYVYKVVEIGGNGAKHYVAQEEVEAALSLMQKAHDADAAEKVKKAREGFVEMAFHPVTGKLGLIWNERLFSSLEELNAALRASKEQKSDEPEVEALKKRMTELGYKIVPDSKEQI